jgi:hypothetical protein
MGATAVVPKEEIAPLQYGTYFAEAGSADDDRSSLQQGGEFQGLAKLCG